MAPYIVAYFFAAVFAFVCTVTVDILVHGPPWRTRDHRDHWDTYVEYLLNVTLVSLLWPVLLCAIIFIYFLDKD